MRTHKYGPIGWTQGGGDCKPDKVLKVFMGLSGDIPEYKGGRNPTGKADPFEGKEQGKQLTLRKLDQQCLADKLPQKITLVNSFLSLPLVGFFGLGGDATSYLEENIVQKYAGCGQSFGLPTTSDDGELEVIYRQVCQIAAIFFARFVNMKLNHLSHKINQDGPGPLTAAVDPTSGATDYKAFQTCIVTHNAPGDGLVGLSLATNTNWVVKIQMPKGLVCSAVVAGVPNVCFIRIRNNAPAGPFGGAGFFTQSKVARKRAIEYRRKKRAEEGLEHL